jgi:Fur family ferric uptake transcriptional regulator
MAQSLNRNHAISRNIEDVSDGKPSLMSGRKNPKPLEEGAGVLIHQGRETVSDFKRIIRDLGLKVTAPRMAILEVLSRGRAHVTAQEVFEKVQVNDPSIGFATVYRFLRYLTEKKFVTEVRMGGLPARYEITPRVHHDHLTCTKCGQIVEFENHDIEELQLLVARNNGFQLTGHVLELYGVCSRCQRLVDRF